MPAIIQPVFDFGEVLSGGEVSHDFILENPTETPVEVTRIRTSCGCTAGKLEPEVIPAHGKGTLHVVFKTGRRTGAQRKHIFMSTRHPGAPLLRCSIEGTLKAPEVPGTAGGRAAPVEAPKKTAEPVPATEPPAPKPAPRATEKKTPTVPARTTVLPQPPKSEIRSNPSALLLGSVAAGKITEREAVLTARDGKAFEVAVLTARDGKAFEVKDCQTPLFGVTATARPADETKTSWKLTVRVGADAKPGRHRGYLNIATDRSDSPFRILVTGKVVKN